MPTNTRVGRCVRKLTKKYGYSGAIGICQKSTKQHYMTGKTLKKRKKNKGGGKRNGRGTSPSAATLAKIKGFINAELAEFGPPDGHFSAADIQWIEKHWKKEAIREWKQEKKAGKNTKGYNVNSKNVLSQIASNITEDLFKL